MMNMTKSASTESHSGTRVTDSRHQETSPFDSPPADLSTAQALPDPVEAEDDLGRLNGFWKTVIVALTVAGILLTMNQVFFWNLFDLSLLTNSFLYLLGACFLPIVFIVKPLLKSAPRRKSVSVARGVQKSHGIGSVPWYDVVLCLILIAVSIYFAWHGQEIVIYGWSFVAPPLATTLSFVYWALVLEVLRRATGWVVALLALIVSVYPLFAESVPFGVLQGVSYDPTILAQIHSMGADSILGVPFQTAGAILVGFLLFGVVLQHTGGADFFHDLSMAVFGRFRGGSAKVAVASSTGMGMMSGSAVSNVLTTGPMTIPAMIRSGFSAKTAGAVEATASSGGSITPPIMGTAAFLMVSFVGVPYTEIIIAAAIPAFLYFLGIFVQIDGYAALHGLHGTPKNRLPRLMSVLKGGWPYIAALALLTFLLFTDRPEAQVPFWVVGVLLVIALLRPSLRFGLRGVCEMMVDAGKTLAQIIGIIAGVGLILGGLSATGVALSLSRDLVALVGENVVLILIAGAIACLVLGMGLTISAAYVFLAIVMAPALTALGVNPIAAHLFVIYWASVSYITPPVGLAAFAASGISKAPPMATCVESMRLGLVKYIVPFGFALNPALVAQAPLPQILFAGLASIVAVIVLGCAFSGRMIGVESRIRWILRVPLAVGGFMLFLPQLWAGAIGFGIIIVVTVLVEIDKRRSAGKQEPVMPKDLVMEG